MIGESHTFQFTCGCDVVELLTVCNRNSNGNVRIQTSIMERFKLTDRLLEQLPAPPGHEQLGHDGEDVDAPELT